MNNDLIKLMKNDRFAAFTGIELLEVEPGYAVAKIDISEKHLNGVDIIQGGVIFTLADFAFAAAANASGQITVAINANISYYQASNGKVLLAEAKEKSVSRKIVNYNVEVLNEHRDLIAQLSITGYKKNKK
ncbi:PaaI family thioesterase [Desulfosporosinus sp.]|uniref:PaaI family thioesterase n=1 Tax=Desulfosporosinus sp. TaxID=157907 RepID=UPI000E960833|nr:PaaI family thioesterase [Desulfosporosinus sp.]MBC2729068.1 PaaI family thioesterase [Desulfosporosinus sp.]HBV86507.1 thioesterase [Desulfosporosinus sp.]